MNKLLLADDSITMQRLVELILADEGFEIKATTDGEEALAAVSSFKPDIVLADIEMPKINGYQLCKRIKQDTSTFHIPIILLAGAFEPFDESLAQQVKADDFIIKPFESQELLNKIRVALTATAEVKEEAVGVTKAPAEGEVTEEEEDLWAMEEIIEAEETEPVTIEEKAETGIKEVAEKVEEVAVEERPVEAPVSEVEEALPTEKAEILEVELPSKDELKEIFEKAVNENISSLLSSIDIKEALLDSLMLSLKDYVKENLPDLTEKMSKEMLEVSLTNITKEVEAVIWKTVPEIAERLISQEIERIRSEF